MHPLTIMKPARTSRRMHNKPEVFRDMVPDIMLDMIIIWGNYNSVEMFFKNLNAQQGFHPRRFGSPHMRYHLNRYYIIIAS